MEDHISRNITPRLSLIDGSIAMEMSEELIQSWMQLGQAHLEKQSFQEALVIFNKIIEVDSENLDAYYFRAFINNRMMQFQQAIFDLNHIISLAPDYVDAYFERANSYNLMRNMPSAIDDLNTVIELAPDYLEAYYARAMANIMAGKPQRATGDLTICLEANPDNIDLYMLRGQTYLQCNIIDRAIIDFTYALELKPDLVNAYIQRAAALGITGDLDSALIDYQVAAQIDPNNAMARFYLGSALLGRSENEKALGELKKALELDTSGSIAWQVIPTLGQLEGPQEIIMPTIDLAFSNKADQVRFEKTAMGINMSMKISEMSMPIAAFAAGTFEDLIIKSGRLCGLDLFKEDGFFTRKVEKEDRRVDVSLTEEEGMTVLKFTLESDEAETPTDALLQEQQPLPQLDQLADADVQLPFDTPAADGVPAMPIQQPPGIPHALGDIKQPLGMHDFSDIPNPQQPDNNQGGSDSPEMFL